MSDQEKIKVLLIDDSVIVLNSLLKILEKDEQIEIVGMAKDGEEGVLKAIELNPDVITLDINMPKMDGRFCLQHIMEKCPTPCIILSKATQLGALESLELLELGAVDFIGKPSRKEIDRNISLVANIIIKKIKQAKSVELKKLLKQTDHEHVEVEKKEFSYDKEEYEGIVAIGSSTGGPQTLSNIITHFPENFPYPIIIAQHIPENFSKALAERLNRLTHLHVKEAENREIIKKGTIYVSPGGKNILIKKVKNNFIIKVVESKDDLNLPNIDKLFMSASECFGKKSVGIVLTGMGDDGSYGLKLIKDSGGVTLAQNPEEAVIGGMPSAARKRVPNCFVMDSEKIIPFLVSFIEG